MLTLWGWASPLTHAEISVDLSLEPEKIRPGDLTTLTAVMYSDQYARFELKLPMRERLRLIALEAGALQLHDGSYRQEHRWILQAVSSGQVEWKELHTEIHFRDHQKNVELGSLTLDIQPYAETDHSMDPERMNEGHVGIQKIIVLFLTIIIPLGFTLIKLMFKRRKA
ncbi:MAG: hypothetical protein AAF571_03545 [Verrucomicrobiota bacterium]